MWPQLPRAYRLHLTLQNVRIFVIVHYQFLGANSFPWTSLSENCSLLGTGNVRGKISDNFFRDKWKLLSYVYERREHMHNNKQKPFILAIFK